MNRQQLEHRIAYWQEELRRVRAQQHRAINNGSNTDPWVEKVRGLRTTIKALRLDWEKQNGTGGRER